MARAICIQCIYGNFGRGITKNMVTYGVYTRFWPTLLVSQCCSMHPVRSTLRITHMDPLQLFSLKYTALKLLKHCPKKLHHADQYPYGHTSTNNNSPSLPPVLKRINPSKHVQSGSARTIYIQCKYGNYGRDITKFTVI